MGSIFKFLLLQSNRLFSSRAGRARERKLLCGVSGLIIMVSAATTPIQPTLQFHVDPEAKAGFAGQTLIAPSVNGIGFVGQLVVDLVLTSASGFTRVGMLTCPLIEPLVVMDGRCVHTSVQN